MTKLAKRLSALALVVLCAVALVACAPANADKAAKKMEKAGYTATALVFKEVADNGAVASVTGTKNELSLSAVTGAYTATLYKTAKQAKAAAEKGGTVVGKWVFVGGEDALKAFKK